VAIGTFDRGSQQTGGGERSGAHTRLADDPHAKAPLCSSGTAGEADEPRPNDENVGGRG